MVQPAESQDAVDAVAKGLVAPRNHACFFKTPIMCDVRDPTRVARVFVQQAEQLWQPPKVKLPRSVQACTGQHHAQRSAWQDDVQRSRGWEGSQIMEGGVNRPRRVSTL